MIRRRNYAVTPMTLGNMRELGVRSLAVTCEICHHEAVLQADRWPDEVPVSTFRPRKSTDNTAMCLVWDGS